MDWKKIGLKLLYPPLWLILILVAVSAASLTAVFIKGQETSPIAYAVYAVAFYTLTALCAVAAKVIPGIYRSAKQKVFDTKYGGRYFTDVVFKTHISLYASFAVNLLYVGVNVLSGLLYGSLWFAILAGYYCILAAMRFLLLRFLKHTGIGNERISEYKRSRLCGIILMTLNFTLSGAVLMMLYQNRGYEYHGILIYVMAMYTFYVTTHSIVDIVKYRRYQSPVMSTAKIINLSAALVSLLSLETAMLSQFGADMRPENKWLMIALTGAGVSIIVVTMSVYMIIRANIEIKKLRRI